MASLKQLRAQAHATSMRQSHPVPRRPATVRATEVARTRHWPHVSELAVQPRAWAPARD